MKKLEVSTSKSKIQLKSDFSTKFVSKMPETTKNIRPRDMSIGKSVDFSANFTHTPKPRFDLSKLSKSLAFSPKVILNSESRPNFTFEKSFSPPSKMNHFPKNEKFLPALSTFQRGPDMPSAFP